MKFLPEFFVILSSLILLLLLTLFSLKLDQILHTILFCLIITLSIIDTLLFFIFFKKTNSSINEEQTKFFEDEARSFWTAYFKKPNTIENQNEIHENWLLRKNDYWKKCLSKKILKRIEGKIMSKVMKLKSS